MGKRILTVEDIIQAAKAGKGALAAAPSECIVTPQARDKARELGVALGAGLEPPGPAPEPSAPLPADPTVREIVRRVADLARPELPAGVDSAELERLVCEAVTARLGIAPPGPAAHPGPSGDFAPSPGGVRFLDFSRLAREASGPVAVAEKVFLAEALADDAGARLAGGHMAWEKASFSRTVERPEIAVVIEGELLLTADGQTRTGRPGDMFYFPPGAAVVYSTPSRVHLACVNSLA